RTNGSGVGRQRRSCRRSARRRPDRQPGRPRERRPAMTVAKIIVAITIFLAGVDGTRAKDQGSRMNGEIQGQDSSFVLQPSSEPSSLPVPAIPPQTVDVYVDAGDKPLAAY